MIITSDYKNKLVERTVQGIIKYNGRIDHMVLEDIFYSPNGKGHPTKDQHEVAAIVLAACTLAVHIPKYVNNQRVFVTYIEGIGRVLLFLNTYREETFINRVSQEPGGLAAYRISGGFDIGPLVARDVEHSYLRQGDGSGLCDSISTTDGLLVEIKHELQNGSPSSCHDGQVVIDCRENKLAYVKKTTPSGRKMVVMPDAKVEAVYDFSKRTDFPVRKKSVYQIPGLDPSLSQLLLSGELIPEVERRIERETTEFKLYK